MGIFANPPPPELSTQTRDQNLDSPFNASTCVLQYLIVPDSEDWTCVYVPAPVGTKTRPFWDPSCPDQHLHLHLHQRTRIRRARHQHRRELQCLRAVHRGDPIGLLYDLSSRPRAQQRETGSVLYPLDRARVSAQPACVVLAPGQT